MTKVCGHCGGLLTGSPRDKYYYMMEKIAEKYGATLGEVLGTVRNKYVVNARREIVLLLHESGMSSAAIGRLMNRDHTTILHSIKMAKNAVAGLAEIELLNAKYQ